MRRFLPRLCSTLLAALLLLAETLPLSAAISASSPSTLSLQEVEDYSRNGVPEDRWPMLMETLGNPGQAVAVRSLVRALKPFPAKRLVELLMHTRLSVRLGALDLLEEAAGDNFAFDPWAEDPANTGNKESIEKWKSWAETGKVVETAVAGRLSEETFRVIAQEIMSGQRDRAERAMLRLEGYGLPAIAHIEAFLKVHADLGDAPRSALKAAEYRLALKTSLPKKAAGLANSLAQGTPEMQSTALGELNHAGPGALPVIADFLSSPDPLVRESAVDAAFAAGDKHAAALVLPMFSTEKTESVLHAMLRGLGNHVSSPEHTAAIAGMLKHPSENVVVSALEALGLNAERTSPPMFDPKAKTPPSPAPPEGVAACLDDPRWRVRAAALDAVKRLKASQLKDKVIARFADEDVFVRSSAVAAYAEVFSGGDDFLRAQFTKHHDLKPAIIRAMISGGQFIPESIWTELATAPPEIILQCLDSLESRESRDGKKIPYATPFAKHKNTDVAAAALRLLAGRGLNLEVLTEALESDDTIRQDAVLDGLHLPKDFLPQEPRSQGESAAVISSGTGTPVDRLYTSFAAAQKSGSAASKGATVSESDVPARLLAVLKKFFKSGSPRQRLRAACALGESGSQDAAGYVVSVYDTLSELDRRSASSIIAGSKGEIEGPARELAVRMLQDPSEDVRDSAVSASAQLLTPELLALLFGELQRDESRLQPDAFTDWTFEQALERSGLKETATQWALKILQEDKARDPVKVYAMTLMPDGGGDAAPILKKHLESRNQWLRRAAYRAMGSKEVVRRLGDILKDESAAVRAVIPFFAVPGSGSWRNFYDDVHQSNEDRSNSLRNYSRSESQAFGAWSERGSVPAGGGEFIEALEALARDPSETVRFEAQFALLRLGKPVDPVAFAALIPLQPEYAGAEYAVQSFISSNYSRLGKSYAVLIPALDDLPSDEVQEILKHFDIKEEQPFASFEAIAKLSPASPAVADTAIAPPIPVREVSSGSFRVLFFFKAGCKDCDRVRDMLHRHTNSFPNMVLVEHDIADPKAVLKNEVLSSRFEIKGTLHQVTPAVFTQAGAIIRDDISFANLGDLLRRTASQTPLPKWDDVAEREQAAAETTIVQRFESFRVGAVIGAGLLDGINPCAFATIIFLLSYLQVARRTPGEILAVGGAFILAVFLTYFVVGLGLAEVLTRLTGIRLAGLLLNYLLAGFALVVALLSFRDARMAARGQMGEMTLQLPAALKDRIRQTIRSSARANRFVLAAFVAGVVVSLLELACTGQVYLPTIQYMLRDGRSGAVGYLLAYNLAFVLPLVVVFILAWLGLRSDDLIRFQKKHTALVKGLTGILFLALAAFLIFSR